jgi:hypothetical protein
LRPLVQQRQRLRSPKSVTHPKILLFAEPYALCPASTSYQLGSHFGFFRHLAGLQRVSA